ncbi:hypothetical protein [Synechococcus sp. M16CYN]|uniref:hypothetical protein n=1 Tax=Synechococcus sp. M16CYN TaxID=3103139 RepID=UPI0033417DBB
MTIVYGHGSRCEDCIVRGLRLHCPPTSRLITPDKRVFGQGHTENYSLPNGDWYAGSSIRPTGSLGLPFFVINFCMVIDFTPRH